MRRRRAERRAHTPHWPALPPHQGGTVATRHFPRPQPLVIGSARVSTDNCWVKGLGKMGAVGVRRVQGPGEAKPKVRRRCVAWARGASAELAQYRILCRVSFTRGAYQREMRRKTCCKLLEGVALARRPAPILTPHPIPHSTPSTHLPLLSFIPSLVTHSSIIALLPSPLALLTLHTLCCYG